MICPEITMPESNAREVELPRGRGLFNICVFANSSFMCRHKLPSFPVGATSSLGQKRLFFCSKRKMFRWPSGRYEACQVLRKFDDSVCAENQILH